MYGVAFHGPREDITTILNALPGGSYLVKALDSIEADVRAEAEKGAKNAIPQIRADVRAEVTPYVYAAIAAGGLGAIFGLAAFIRVMRAR